MSEIIFPTAIANMDGHDQATNLVSWDLTANRTIHLTGEVNDMTALNIITQLRYLASRSDDDITIYINSPGGSVSAGLAIYDAMKFGIRCDVRTVATGIAASMGALLLAAGTKGKRYASPNAEIMIHQPLSGVQGSATDIGLACEHIQRTKKRLNGILAEACGRTEAEVAHDTDRDNWKTAAEAMAYGLVDHVGFPDAQEVSYD